MRRVIHEALWSFLVILLCGGSVVAHEHWVDTSAFYPVVGDTVPLHVCSGHYFPKSSFALKDAVLHKCFSRDSEGSMKPLVTETAGKQRTGRAVPRMEGAWIVGFALKRPQAADPVYEAKTILVVGGVTQETAGYANGDGLELVPQESVAALKEGDELPVALLLDGQPVAATITATAENGKTAFPRTQAGRPAMVAITKSGRYLLTAALRGRGCSLVFFVKEDASQ